MILVKERWLWKVGYVTSMYLGRNILSSHISKLCCSHQNPAHHPNILCTTSCTRYQYIGSSPVIENCACTYSYRTATPTSSAFSIFELRTRTNLRDLKQLSYAAGGCTEELIVGDLSRSKEDPPTRTVPKYF